MSKFLSRWHNSIEDKVVDSSMMVDEVEFCSPLVYKPIIGVEMVTKYLVAANDVLNNPHFKYISEFTDEKKACLVFETKLDDVEVTGIDLIEWNNEDKMVKLSVFIRPFSALTKVGEQMSMKLTEIS
ncbi:MAG: nuclear transport factor 2 family protein [Gammaproteobacteria bacterium]|jgi:hypothetical protein|nr:nuclear transport factor 2 family protein [Gammaproteobacteria bacterium]HJL80326.1 nuclear transport factor 2 family protein [Gammaproteobacteria bacterium]HJM09647.1 nuclear transport factor 2 family protein [Gammaproteobacteria bacterium]HJN00288.1 nuclear transport factor 2 family protein [Gammaproteobacteria bacterium]|tara:strand:+ start:43948 stop:44328 length:381 start_codon:yes stop_codon:yes gene_type:complete